jgi:hypothetical protein
MASLILRFNYDMLAIKCCSMVMNLALIRRVPAVVRQHEISDSCVRYQSQNVRMCKQRNGIINTTVSTKGNLRIAYSKRCAS